MNYAERREDAEDSRGASGPPAPPACLLCLVELHEAPARVPDGHGREGGRPVPPNDFRRQAGEELILDDLLKRVDRILEETRCVHAHEDLPVRLEGEALQVHAVSLGERDQGDVEHDRSTPDVVAQALLPLGEVPNKRPEAARRPLQAPTRRAALFSET